MKLRHTGVVIGTSASMPARGIRQGRHVVSQLIPATGPIFSSLGKPAAFVQTCLMAGVPPSSSFSQRRSFAAAAASAVVGTAAFAGATVPFTGCSPRAPSVSDRSSLPSLLDRAFGLSRGRPFSSESQDASRRHGLRPSVRLSSANGGSNGENGLVRGAGVVSLPPLSMHLQNTSMPLTFL